MGPTILAFSLVAFAAVVLAMPPGRKIITEILLSWRHVFIEMPLRLYTGRRKPDYARIRELEIECGLADPEPRGTKVSGLGFVALPMHPYSYSRLPSGELAWQAPVPQLPTVGVSMPEFNERMLTLSDYLHTYYSPCREASDGTQDQ